MFFYSFCSTMILVIIFIKYCFFIRRVNCDSRSKICRFIEDGFQEGGEQNGGVQLYLKPHAN